MPLARAASGSSRGDWDEMCGEWFEHERDPRYQYLYIGRGTQVFLTRAAEERVRELLG